MTMDAPSLGSANATGLGKLLPKSIVEKRRRRKMRQKLERELDGGESDGETESVDGSSDANRMSWMSTASTDFGALQHMQQEDEKQDEVHCYHDHDHEPTRTRNRTSTATDTAPGHDGAAGIDS